MLTQRLEAARAGDTSAREAIVSLLRPRLNRLARYYARRTGEDADDLIQEGWCGVLAGLPEVNPLIGQADQYLLLRARWRMLECVRNSRRGTVISLEDVRESELVCEGGVFVQACAAEFMSALNGRQRTVVQFLLLGLTLREIAAELDCSSANIAWHVRVIRYKYKGWVKL